MSALKIYGVVGVTTSTLKLVHCGGRLSYLCAQCDFTSLLNIYYSWGGMSVGVLKLSEKKLLYRRKTPRKDVTGMSDSKN